MRPSLKTIILSAYAAISSSCVTMMIVIPCVSLKDFKSSITSLLLTLSRFPVGSSAKITIGFVAIALAIATRCCCPPESSAGVWSATSSKPTLISASLVLLRRSLSGTPRYMRGSSTFSKADVRPKRLNP